MDQDRPKKRVVYIIFFKYLKSYKIKYIRSISKKVEKYNEHVRKTLPNHTSKMLEPNYIYNKLHKFLVPQLILKNPSNKFSGAAFYFLICG